MSNIDALKGRLQELSNRLTAKDKLGKDYKKIVSDSLARIKAKITKILADHNKQVQDITQGSAENLEKTRAELVAQQARLKQASDAALEGARRNQDELQNNLAATNQQLNDLQAELNKPSPDTQSMQVIIEKLRQDLQTATNASAAANGQIVELTARLVAYDGMRDKMDKLVQSLIDQIGKILTQVEIMSINQDDVVELMQLLDDTENLFPKDDGAPPGNDDGGIFDELFGSSSSNNVRPNNKGAGGSDSSGPSDFIPPPDNEDSGDESRRVASRPVKTGLGGLPIREPRIPNTAPGQYDPGLLKPIESNKNLAGGKTKRRRGKRTMHRGGYVEAKKSATRNRRNRPRTSSRRRSSSSSSSASSNSRQKAMKTRKM
jgi:hypothetical protein